MNRGNAYDGTGELDQAIAEFTKAIDLAPKLALAYASRGAAYAKKGDPDQTIADASKAIELDPKYALRGWAYAKKGDPDQTIADASKAIELDPKLAMAYNNRAAAYFKVGRAAQGLPDAEKALELAPGNEHQAKHLRRKRAVRARGRVSSEKIRIARSEPVRSPAFSASWRAAATLGVVGADARQRPANEAAQ